MDSDAKDKTYKSPIRKLVHFFENSRDQWKAKHRKAKANEKRLKNRVRFLENSKGQKKQRVEELETEVARLKAREQALEHAAALLEKKRNNERAGLEDLKNWQQVPYHHAYSVGCISLFISLVLSAAVSMRGTSRAMGVFFDALHLPFSCPSWFTLSLIHISEPTRPY